MRHLTLRAFLPMAALCAVASVPPIAAQSAPLPAVQTAEAEREEFGVFADRITYDEDAAIMTFEGNVIALKGEYALRTDLMVYDDTTGKLSFPQGFSLQTPEGDMISSQGGTLADDFETGLLDGVRSVVGRNLQVAAMSMQRLENERTLLYKAVASSCTICAEDETPIWQLRADRILHDRESGQFHYENAYLDLLGVPVLYLPYFRHADPDAGRISGFLTPEMRSSDTLGFSAKLPYYHVIDDHSDITLTPVISSLEDPIIEAEYRKLFAQADLNLETSLKFRDAGLPRGYVFADYERQLEDSKTLRVNLDLASDKAYLQEFDYSQTDRLTSDVSLSKFTDDTFWDIRGTYFQSLRDSESAGQVPLLLPETEYIERETNTGWLGGRIGVKASSATLIRDRGRDVLRGTLGADWERSTYFENGLVGRGFGDVRLDLYRVTDDSTYDNAFITRLRPLVGAELRFPLISRGEGGVNYVMEPMLQVIAAGEGATNTGVPNEDSLQVDFDNTNLFSVSRFTGEDRYEPGLRANIGTRFERISPDGWSLGASVGQVLRAENTNVFGSGTGLGDTQSNYVSTLSFDNESLGIEGDARFLFDQNFASERSEFVISWDQDDRMGQLSYVNLKKNAALGETQDRSEIAVEFEERISDYWTGNFGHRRDFENASPISTQLGMTYENECIRVTAQMERGFTTTNSVDPYTLFTVSLTLAGIGNSVQGTSPARSCAIAR